MKADFDARLASAIRRYRNAKRRARYWSNNPSFSLYVSRCTDHSRLTEKYEIAMCDCKNWEAEIELITGVRPTHYDPKAAFAKLWNKLMNANARREGTGNP